MPKLLLMAPHTAVIPAQRLSRCRERFPPHLAGSLEGWATSACGHPSRRRASARLLRTTADVWLGKNSRFRAGLFRGLRHRHVEAGNKRRPRQPAVEKCLQPGALDDVMDCAIGEVMV